MGVLRGRGLRCVRKIGTPIKILTKRVISGLTWHRIAWGEKVMGDTTALAPGGRGVLIETKTITDRNLQYSDLRKHQPGDLSRYADAEGIALLVWVHHSGVYVMEWPIPGFEPGTSISPEYARELDIQEFENG